MLRNALGRRTCESRDIRQIRVFSRTSDFRSSTFKSGESFFFRMLPTKTHTNKNGWIFIATAWSAAKKSGSKVAGHLRRLATLLASQGRAAQAIPLWIRVLEIERPWLGSGHQDVQMLEGPKLREGSGITVFFSFFKGSKNSINHIFGV